MKTHILIAISILISASLFLYGCGTDIDDELKKALDNDSVSADADDDLPGQVEEELEITYNFEDGQKPSYIAVSESSNWIIDSSMYGNFSFRSAEIGSGQTSCFGVTVSVPYNNVRLTFYMRTNFTDQRHITLTYNGQPLYESETSVISRGGVNAWSKIKSVTIAADTWLFKWCVTGTGTGHAWVDNITLPDHSVDNPTPSFLLEDRYEPNNRMGEAFEINSSTGKLNLTLHEKNEEDWFSVGATLYDRPIEFISWEANGPGWITIYFTNESGTTLMTEEFGINREVPLPRTFTISNRSIKYIRLKNRQGIEECQIKYSIEVK